MEYALSPIHTQLLESMSVNRQSMRDQIRETLLRRFGLGELPPGPRLLETQLAKE